MSVMGCPERGRVSVLGVLFSTVAMLCLGCSKGAPSPAEPAVSDGKALFSAHCASCHGPLGRGDGPAAYLLYPRPRDFAGEVFRLVSTTNGIPTDADLMDVISRGMLGSSMPPHAHLPEADRRALVQEVRRLMLEGRVEIVKESARANGDELDDAAIRKLALREPGPPAELPAWKEPTPESLARGRDVFQKNCASCHDADGRGATRSDFVDSLGRPTAARDLTAGILKGGTSETDVLRRIVVGMPGSPMPASGATLGADDALAVAHHVRALMRKWETERLSQARKTLVASKVSTDIDGSIDQSVWDGIPSQWIALAPLWWRDRRVEGLDVQVASDGRRIAFRIGFADGTMDHEQYRPDQFSDGLAIQFSSDPAPPFFAMGEKGRPVEIVYWRAAFQDDLGGRRDAAQAHGTVINDIDMSIRKPPIGAHVGQQELALAQHDPLYLSGWGAGNPISDPARTGAAEALRAEGFGTLRYAKPASEGVHGRGRHADGRWTVVLTRDLGAGDAVRNAGAQASIGFAAWDGAVGDRDGQKNVSIWHRLEIKNGR